MLGIQGIPVRSLLSMLSPHLLDVVVHCRLANLLLNDFGVDWKLMVRLLLQNVPVVFASDTSLCAHKWTNSFIGHAAPYHYRSLSSFNCTKCASRHSSFSKLSPYKYLSITRGAPELNKKPRPEPVSQEICPPPKRICPPGPNFLRNLSPPPLRKFVPLQTSNVRLLKVKIYYIFYESCVNIR